MSWKDWLLIGFLVIGYTGCSGSVNTAILFLSNGYAFRDFTANLLWYDGKLDCLPDQYPIRWVPEPKGKRECQLQEPCHPGKFFNTTTINHQKQYNFHTSQIYSLNFNAENDLFFFFLFFFNNPFWIFGQWFEVLDGLLGPYWKAVGLAFNCTFLLCGSVIQLIACARSSFFFFCFLFLFISFPSIYLTPKGW